MRSPETEGRAPELTFAEYEFGAALLHYEEMVQKYPDGGEEFGKARRRVLDLFRRATAQNSGGEAAG